MRFETFKSGLGFIEGPVWTRDGSLAVVSISHGCVYILDGESGEVRQKIDTGGGPNGLVAYDDGFLVAQNGGIFGASGVTKGGVQKIVDGKVELLFADAFTAPNDLCFGPDGRLYVTDPLTDLALTQPIDGRVVACDLATGQWEVVVERRLFPNGLAFDRTGKFLYLAQTYSKLIEKLSVANGTVSSEEIFCHIANGRPDGMALDQEGNLWVCTPGTGGIEVFSEAGQPLRRIELGEGTMTTNCCFGGPEMSDLFVTAAARGTVFKLKTESVGLKLHPR